MCVSIIYRNDTIRQPSYQQNLIDKLVEKENERNDLTDSPNAVPYTISVAARVVQVRSSSNEQGQSKEEHTGSIPLEGKAEG